MGFLKTNNCCCCFSLRTGGLIIGWLGVISGILGIIRNLNRSDAYYEGLVQRSQLFNVYLSPEEDLISMIITVIISSLLLYGIYKKRSSFLLPQVVVTVFSFIVLLIYIGIILISFIIVLSSRNHDAKTGSAVALTALIIIIPAVGLFWHLTAVLYSLYQKIKEENQNHPVVVCYIENQNDPYKV